jgi:hypothetical protein
VGWVWFVGVVFVLWVVVWFLLCWFDRKKGEYNELERDKRMWNMVVNGERKIEGIERESDTRR